MFRYLQPQCHSVALGGSHIHHKLDSYQLTEDSEDDLKERDFEEIENELRFLLFVTDLLE